MERGLPEKRHPAETGNIAMLVLPVKPKVLLPVELSGDRPACGFSLFFFILRTRTLPGDGCNEFPYAKSRAESPNNRIFRVSRMAPRVTE
jgi:hypothetical protein